MLLKDVVMKTSPLSSLNSTYSNAAIYKIVLASRIVHHIKYCICISVIAFSFSALIDNVYMCVLRFVYLIKFSMHTQMS